MTAVQTSGLSLKLQRVGQDIKALDLAARMGVSSSTVSRIENSRVVSDKVARQYLDALATFATVASDAGAPQQPASAA
jgi:transcriptional regulator with XRE-family HTH domain